MPLLEVSGAVRPIYGSLGVKRLNTKFWDDAYRGLSFKRDSPLIADSKEHALLFREFIHYSLCVFCHIMSFKSNHGLYVT